jgi:hypothetical protein
VTTIPRKRTTIFIRKGSSLERLVEQARAEGQGLTNMLHELAAGAEAQRLERAERTGK